MVDLAADLLEELKTHKLAARYAGPDDFVFPTRLGTRRDRNTVRTRILYPAIARANIELARAGRGPIPDAALTLEVYTDVGDRRHPGNDRLGARLLSNAGWKGQE